MHCLSLIREAIYRDDFDYTGYINTTRITFDRHVNHCLLALKQVIECKSDASPVVLEVVEDMAGEKGSELSVWRLRDSAKRCRRYDPLKDWYSKNSVCSSWCGAPEIYTGIRGKHDS